MAHRKRRSVAAIFAVAVLVGAIAASIAALRTHTITGSAIASAPASTSIALPQPPRGDGALYLLRLRAEGPEKALEPLMEVTAAIDNETVITR